MPHIHWVERQNKLEIPKEKDEVNKRAVRIFNSFFPTMSRILERSTTCLYYYACINSLSSICPSLLVKARARLDEESRGRRAVAK
jgi:hypothetical protein